VPQGTARLRVAFTARHPDSEIERLAAAVRRRIIETKCATISNSKM
jgi:7-keto-8-aminopelargonate synthetase-like enzyme